MGQAGQGRLVVGWVDALGGMESMESRDTVTACTAGQRSAVRRGVEQCATHATPFECKYCIPSATCKARESAGSRARRCGARRLTHTQTADHAIRRGTVQRGVMR